MVNPNDKKDGAPPREIHVEGKKPINWLAWAALAAGILALLFALSRRNTEEPRVADMTNTTTTVEEPAAMPAAMPTATVPGTAGIGAYLAGTEALPRTFVFEKLNFDTAKSEVRAADRAELTSIVTALRDNQNARIRVIGYADARGDAGGNAELGKARAEAVKAALVADGIAAARIEAASGGEGNPVDTNATATGQAENRRTEIAVLAR